MIGHRRVQSRRWAAVVGRYRPSARSAGSETRCAAGNWSLPARTRPGRDGRARCGGSDWRGGRPGGEQATRWRPLQDRGRSRASDAAHRSSSNSTWPCRAALGGGNRHRHPVVTLVAGIWPQTDDSAVLAQFTGESRSSKRSPRPKIHRSAHPVTGGTLAIQATTGFAAIFGAGGVVGGLIAKSLEG